MIEDIDFSKSFLLGIIKSQRKAIIHKVYNVLSYQSPYDDVEEKITTSILLIELCELVLRLRKFIEDKEINDLYVN